MQLAQQINENSADPAKMLKTVQICTHCGTETTKDSLFCPDCRTDKQRQEICAENKEINPNYKCRKCGVGIV